MSTKKMRNQGNQGGESPPVESGRSFLRGSRWGGLEGGVLMHSFRFPIPPFRKGRGPHDRTVTPRSATHFLTCGGYFTHAWRALARPSFLGDELPLGARGDAP